MRLFWSRSAATLQAHYLSINRYQPVVKVQLVKGWLQAWPHRRELLAVWPLNIHTLSNIWGLVESPYDIRCLIQKEGCNCLALFDTGTSFVSCRSSGSCFKAPMKSAIVWMFSSHTVLRLTSLLVVQWHRWFQLFQDVCPCVSQVFHRLLLLPTDDECFCQHIGTLYGGWENDAIVLMGKLQLVGADCIIAWVTVFRHCIVALRTMWIISDVWRIRKRRIDLVAFMWLFMNRKHKSSGHNMRVCNSNDANAHHRKQQTYAGA